MRKDNLFRAIDEVRNCTDLFSISQWRKAVPRNFFGYKGKNGVGSPTLWHQKEHEKRIGGERLQRIWSNPFNRDSRKRMKSVLIIVIIFRENNRIWMKGTGVSLLWKTPAVILRPTYRITGVCNAVAGYADASSRSRCGQWPHIQWTPHLQRFKKKRETWFYNVCHLQFSLIRQSYNVDDEPFRIF